MADLVVAKRRCLDHPCCCGEVNFTLTAGCHYKSSKTDYKITDYKLAPHRL